MIDPIPDSTSYAGLRGRIARENLVTGTFVSISAPSVVEMIALAGFSTVCLDAEHAPYSIGDLEGLLRAAELHGADALVRVSDGEVEISRALDAGARGVLVPRVENAEQAATAVSLARYPAEGSRGAGPGRASGYGARLGETLATANSSVAVLVQVETVAGVENAAEIAAVPGLDAVFVGPGDLSVSLGVPMGSPEHLTTIRRIFDVAHAAGCRTGIFVADPADVATYRALGVTFFLVQSDSMFLLARAGEVLARATPADAEVAR